MEFRKYQHVERLNTDQTEGILIGECFIFPKIDGTNGVIWHDGEKLRAGSRKRELNFGEDNRDFLAEMSWRDDFKQFFKDYEGKNIYIYGEWLVKHTLKTYRKEAWKKFYVFDVVIDERHLPYREYSKLLAPYNIEVIPPMQIINDPTMEQLFKLLKKNTYLVQDGKGVGEGIVVKNYDYKNKHGKQKWGKLVNNEFKERLSKNPMFDHNRAKEGKKQVEKTIIEEHLSKHMVEKTIEKIRSERGEFSSKNIPELLQRVYYDIITEELWDALKGLKKQKIIDFKLLQIWSNSKVKELKPEFF